MRNKILKIFILLVVFFVMPNFAKAVTGDVLAEDLHETSSVVAIRTRTIQTVGCAPGGTGECIKMDCTDGNCSGIDLWSVEIPDSPEITIVWNEKYDVWPLANANCKSIRPYIGDGAYTSALISAFLDENMYISTWDSAKIQPTNAIADMWETPPHTDGCTTSDYITFTCAQGVGSGKIKFLPEFPMGTEWNKMRYWIKMPTSRSSSDGEIKLWKNEILQLHLYDIDMADSGFEPPVTTHVNFAPIDASSTPHGHWYDEISIYEGYVPPNGLDATPPSAPTGLAVM